jgi:hypothetical protein
MSAKKKAIWEGVKFVLRIIVLFGIPAVLTAVIDAQPKWAVVIGMALAFIDKVIHKLPNEYKGLLPF